MKKLIAVFLILTACVLTLTSCLDDALGSVKDLVGDKLGIGGESSDKNSSDELVGNLGDNLIWGNGQFNTVSNGLPIYQDNDEPGEEITQEIYDSIPSGEYVNFTFQRVGYDENGVECITVCAIGDSIIMQSSYEDGKLVRQACIFVAASDGKVYEANMNIDTCGWTFVEKSEMSSFGFPIGDMPCEFSALTFEAEKGAYYASIDLGDGSLSNVTMKFKDGKLSFACVDAQDSKAWLYIYDYGTTSIYFPWKSMNSTGIVADGTTEHKMFFSSASEGAFGDFSATFQPSEGGYTVKLPEGGYVVNSNGQFVDKDGNVIGSTVVIDGNKIVVDKEYYEYYYYGSTSSDVSTSVVKKEK